MDKLTKNQEFHLILSDIAMAMSIQTLDAAYQMNADAAGYAPGSIRDDWYGRVSDKSLNQRVTALANAGLASLSNLSGEDLLDKATRFGVPLDAAQAEDIATHFHDKRNAVLTYNR